MAKTFFASTETKFQLFNFMDNQEFCQNCQSDQMPINEEKCRDCGEKYYTHKKSTKKLTMNELINNTRQWFHDKGIIANSTPLKQLEKTQEELTETRDAVIRHEYAAERVVQFSLDQIKDGIGDTVVTLIGVCEMYGFSLEECLQMAYDTISKRNGTMIDGVFVKSK